MNSLDYILFIPLLYGFYRGFTKGLIIELASLLALTLGIYGALHFSSFTFEFLSDYVEIKAVYLQLASYGLTFIIIVMLISLTGKILTMLIKLVALGFINRMMGAIFGGIKVLLILAVFISFFDRFNKQFRMVNDEILSSSLMYNPILIQVEEFYPNVLEEFEKQKESLENLNEDELF
jgi:membrane protein required for colicin V production